MASNIAELGGISVPADFFHSNFSKFFSLPRFFLPICLFLQFSNFHLGNFSFHSLKFLFTKLFNATWETVTTNSRETIFSFGELRKTHKTGVKLETEATTVLYRFEAEHEMKRFSAAFPRTRQRQQHSKLFHTNNEEKFFLRRRIGHAVAIWATKQLENARALAVLVVSASEVAEDWAIFRAGFSSRSREAGPIRRQARRKKQKHKLDVFIALLEHM